MSSPLSTLKKLKRTPLQQWEKSDIYPRRDLLKEFQAAAADNGSSISDLNPPVTFNTKKSQRNDSSLSSSDLISPLMQRLCSLEERVAAQAEDIQCKDKRIAVLEEALRVKKEIFEKRYLMLQRQVFEMESFLMDYNMIWVGSENTDAQEFKRDYCSNGRWTTPGSKFGNSLDAQFCINFDLVVDNIQELNLLAGEGETCVQATTTGAQLVQKKSLELRLYKNGILVSNGPFRTYREQKTQQFIQDLMDGYFPSELQERYPDGVPFEVHDRRDEWFIPKLQRQTFPGLGRVIRGDNGKSLSSAAPTSGEKLPPGLFKTGQIKNITEVPDAVLQGSSDSGILVDTPALQEIRESSLLQSECPSSNEDVITLKIRSEDGSRIFILKMSSSETIGQIRQYLHKNRGGDLPSYDIISLYPPRCYDNNSQTIRACKLTTNTTLLLRTRPDGNY